MPDYFRKVRAGEPFRPAAPTWNAMLDAAQAHQANKRTGGAVGPVADAQPDVVHVYNASGSAVGAFGILGLDGEVLVNPVEDLQQFISQPCLRGVTPTTDHTGRFVVTLNQIAAGGIGRAIISGIAMVPVNMTADFRRATVKPGDTTQLQGSDFGAEIVYVAGGNGTKWALVRLGATPDLGTLLAVNLEMTSGDPGTASSPCTYVYTIKSLNGRTLATGMSPARPRLLNAAHVEATNGTAYVAADGSIVLWEAFETLQQTNCG